MNSFVLNPTMHLKHRGWDASMLNRKQGRERCEMQFHLPPHLPVTAFENKILQKKKQPVLCFLLMVQADLCCL